MIVKADGVYSDKGRKLKTYKYADGTPYVNTKEGRRTIESIYIKQIGRIGGSLQFFNGDNMDYSADNVVWYPANKPKQDMRGKSRHLGEVTGLSVYSRRRVKFPTLARAAQFLGKNQSSISRAIRERRPCGGYDWFYSKETK